MSSSNEFRRNPEFQFVSTDVNLLLDALIAGYERLTGTVVQPASPERLFIQWVADIVIQERVVNNYIGNQNLPSRADGENLDELGQLFYGLARPDAQPAVSRQRFHISAAQKTSILIPAGTRVTDASSTLIWATVADAYVPIGGLYADVQVVCQMPGVIGNGYAPGQINKLIDVSNIPFYEKTGNISVSDTGADRADDGEYYSLMRDGTDALSTAGSEGAYIYHAKKASAEIADVLPVCPAPGQVSLFVLMKGGGVAGEEIKRKVYDACSRDDVRPLTDYVVVDDPDAVIYDIDLVYFISSSSDVSSAVLEAAVADAVEGYIGWQCGKLGRDINPDELRRRLMLTGIKRVDMRSPCFTVLRDGKHNAPGVPPVPQIAVFSGVANVVNGGYEDE